MTHRPEPAVPAEHVEAFRRDGFVCVPDLLTAKEVDHFGKAVDAGVARRTARVPRLEDRTAYGQSFLQVINLWEDHPEIRGLTFHPRIGAVAAALLGVERLRLWHDQALYKEAGGRETDAHQDQPYWPIEETDTITAWIPFDDVDDEHGPTAYVPGSHRYGVRKFSNIFFGRSDGILDIAAQRGGEPRFVYPRRGSVVFHHGLTIHLAKANLSNRMRRVHTAIFFRDGSTRRAKGVHECVDRAGIQAGQPIDSDVTPIAWPRPKGDTPARPTHPVPKNSLGRLLWPPD